MADAPKFKLWWSRVEGTSVLQMRRQDWVALVGSMAAPIAFDVRGTPMAGVAQVSSVLATVAHQFAEATAQVSIYRWDEKDQPTPINKDDYDVWLDLHHHPDLLNMIHTATTSYDDNFERFAAEHVFFVKKEPGPDHWLPTIPSSIAVLLQRKTRDAG
jgi:hypothetical protein